jgi:hypothetical protein
MDKRIRAKKDYHKFLSMIFKEILQLIPEEGADKLAAGYKAGRTIHLFIGESAHGRFKKTAFAYTLGDDQSWRGLPKPDDTVN